MERDEILALFEPLSLEQGLYLLDSLTWFPMVGADRLTRISDYIAARTPDETAPTSDLLTNVLSRLDESAPSRGEPSGDGRWSAIPHAKRLYELKYDLKAVLLPDKWFTFMNMGWQAPGEPDPDLSSWLPGRQAVWVYSANLYELVVSQVDVQGRDVLEVGSGRGGGAGFIYRRWRPASYTAIDQSSNNLAFACTTQPDDIDFRLGDAEKLPVAASSVDAVVNIESAHCYPRPEAFFSEVTRVLRPGGHLLFADEWWSGTTSNLLAAVQGTRLRIIEHRDITGGIIEALDRLGPLMRPLVEAQEGSRRRIYERFFGNRVLTESLHSYTSGRFCFHLITAVRER